MSAAPLGLSAAEARRLAFASQFRPLPGDDPAENAASALSGLGYVQIDTISVVERAHHHVLWSRDRAYRPPVLARLEAPPRRAFEYWAHAAAYLPLEDYRYCLPRMRRVAETGHEWFPTDPAVVAGVYARIRDEGPLRSVDFQSEGARGPWWDWKPAKAALEYLFMSGRLLVVTRPGFQKLYDLAERVYPEGAAMACPGDDEMGDWYVARAASSLGVFSESDLAYMRKDGVSGLRAALARAVEAGTMAEARIEGDERRRAWVASGCLKPGFGAGDDGRPVRVLSPFDNLVIDRRRTRRIFGLEYTLECYVPAAKRVFGYFSLPVFWEGEPAGLVDCKADRSRGVLVVNNARFAFGEAGVGWAGLSGARSPAPEGFPDAFAGELEAFAAFNGCSAIEPPSGGD